MLSFYPRNFPKQRLSMLFILGIIFMKMYELMDFGLIENVCLPKPLWFKAFYCLRFLWKSELCDVSLNGLQSQNSKLFCRLRTHYKLSLEHNYYYDQTRSQNLEFILLLWTFKSSGSQFYDWVSIQIWRYDLALWGLIMGKRWT